jgi:hypothetical protein
MTPFAPKLKPSFFWQGILITLPVLVLAGLGLVSLRQDKALARHEAEQRAQAIGDELLPKCWTALTNQTAEPRHHRFEVDPNGQLLVPPSCPITPIPFPSGLQNLSPAQTELWQKAQKAECDEKSPQAAVEVYREFLQKNPPQCLPGLRIMPSGCC